MLSDRKIEERNIRKAQILSGALKVFKIHGIDKTTMDEVAHESGFGKATLYYYYASKDEVFIDIMENGWKNLWEGIESLIVEEKSPKKKFTGIIKKIAKIVKSDKNLYEFLFTAPRNINIPNDKANWKEYQGRTYATLQSVVDEGISQGDFANIKPELFMKAVGGLYH